MPRIQPFRGILYNPKKVNISKVVAPPYDVISPKMQGELYRGDEHNIVRLILGKDDPASSKKANKYKRAAQFFKQWLADKVLIPDKTPSIYVYGQEYFHTNRKKARLGFISRMEIEDPRTSRVLPHEYTFSKPKEDRLKLLREVRANLSPIFSLFQDDGNKINSILKTAAGKNPIVDIELEGVRHRLWRLDNGQAIKKIQALMFDKDIFIADGHHRYEVAVMYRNEMCKKDQRPTTNDQRLTTNKQRLNGYDYVMMYFAPLNDEGLTILSTHRVIKKIGMDIEQFLEKLEECFYIKPFKSDKYLFEEMASVKKGEYLFGMYLKNGQFYLLRLKRECNLDTAIKENKSREWKRLDVSILHGLIFDNILGLRERIQTEDNIIYTREPDYAISEVSKGNFEAAFFLNPTEIRQVRAIAKNGDRMPHKSTYFYPKLLSGLVINKLA